LPLYAGEVFFRPNLFTDSKNTKHLIDYISITIVVSSLMTFDSPNKYENKWTNGIMYNNFYKRRLIIQIELEMLLGCGKIVKFKIRILKCKNIINEVKPSSWGIGGKVISTEDSVSFVNIKVSKGTTNPEEIANMHNLVKKLMSEIMTNHVEANYFIIDELNPEGWGFGDITMSNR
jgi:phenylpyruvate tautomerase PptA (4-oxalocrotonate tautomerase family)